MASDCGCDAVKFQKRAIDVVYSPETLKIPRESPWGTTTREQKQGLEFGNDEFMQINRYAHELGIDWFASAWDIESQKFLQPFDLKYNKVASAMTTHTEFCEFVASEKKPTFISTGMCEMSEIDKVVEIFKQAACPYTLMHSVSVYPCDDIDLNLACIKTLTERYQVPVGYSGHEVSPTPSVLAAALGAVAIERHITLGRSMYGSDQSASLERRGLEMLVSGIRCCERSLGDGVKTVSEGERAVAQKLRYWES